MKGVAKVCLAVVVTAALCMAVGLLVGRFALCPSPSSLGAFLPGVSQAIVKDANPEVSKLLIDSISRRKIEDNLRELTSQPHIAGSEREHELARKMRQFWLDAGMDDVTMAPYDVLLSFPDPNKPSLVSLKNESGHVVFQSPTSEKVLTPGEDHPDVVPPYNAYSAAGTVEGELVYVNYGRVEDYAWLENNNVNVSGKIVIARYGKIFRGSKVKIAERHGVVGVILYSDPRDYTAYDDGRVYPATWWLPPTGVQRGTTLIEGDPLTPDYPSIGSAYRMKESDTPLPKIPCHPIGYATAQRILRAMGGEQAPDEWRGSLNVSYNLGPGFVEDGMSVELSVSTKNQRKTTYNVIGIIRGAVEPDRYVMLGNHRDAWVFGAIDPSSGTAVMMEVSRAMGQLVQEGRWRPRRSIMFCSWGAEEFGLVGSTEWVEHYVKNLQNRAVAYLNIDIAVQGNYSLRALGTPILRKVIYAATKKVPTPDPADLRLGYKTVYDKWSASFPEAKGSHLPLLQKIGSGSDYAPLLQKAGVSAVDFRYTFNTNKMSLSSYPLYHSVHETFYAVKNLLDKDFEYHRAVARVGVEMARHLADSLILPFSLWDYANDLNADASNLMAAYGDKLRRHLTNIDDLDDAIVEFSDAVRDFEKRLETINRNDPLVVRMINDQLMLLDKAFLDPNGLPLRPNCKHLLYAESKNDAYHGSTFPGLADILFEIDLHPDRDEHWEKVKRHFSVLLFTIQSAASTLKDVTKFVSDHL